MTVLPYGHHWVDEEDIRAVVRVLRSDWITQGPLIEQFEGRVASRCGARFAVAFSSGTAALHAACFAAGIGPGDEVVTTPLTFVATANGVVYQGGRPVFADIDPETFNLSPETILPKLTPRTKAILTVHFAGLPCEMGKIHRMARERNLTVLEDACHALGAEWVSPEGRREKVGSCSHSDLAVFSFHPVKHITTAEGGMVLTNREDWRDQLRMFRHHGLAKIGEDEGANDQPWRSEMRLLGHNYRITDLQCALGLSQLGKLDRFLKRRAEIAAAYREAFEPLGIVSQREGAAPARHAWHLYVVQLPLESLKVDRKTFFSELRQKGVGAGVHYLPVHLHPYYRERFSTGWGDCPVAERYYERAITLPLFPKMSDQEVRQVIDAVGDLFRTFCLPKASPTLTEVSTTGR